LRNELIKKEIRQKCPATPGIFFFGSRLVLHVAVYEILARP
jgi:hypothetical protein